MSQKVFVDGYHFGPNRLLGPILDPEEGDHFWLAQSITTFTTNLGHNPHTPEEIQRFGPIRLTGCPDMCSIGILGLSREARPFVCGGVPFPLRRRAVTAFGQTVFGHFFVVGWWVGWVVGPGGWWPRGVGGPKFRAFFSLPPQLSFFLPLLVVASFLTFGKVRRPLRLTFCWAGGGPPPPPPDFCQRRAPSQTDILGREGRVQITTLLIPAGEFATVAFGSHVCCASSSSRSWCCPN